MKLTHKLCGAALVAVAGVALAVPNTTKANSIEGAGHIGFTNNTGIPTITDNSSSGDSSGDTGTGSTITSNETFEPTDPGTFGVFAVTPLEFGSGHSTLTASSKTYNADLYDNGNNVKSANFVSFYDVREASRDYKLSAQITSEFQTTGGAKLNGATLEYKNTWVNDYANSVAPKGLKASATVTKDASTPLIENSAAGTTAGYGQHDLVFGERKADNTGNAKESVILTIPTADNAVVVAGDYNAVITWTLSETL
ncbi:MULTISPECIES: WxL domain-containing protein [unclassified Enterococcus]|uniref:WxL domain-containing protein n=1 Tax=unclassified Enterococcus TaxID=2608891 RepID=UPI001CE1C0D9|nr:MULTISPECIES: WxL domain-containing protein [unclassified Enterococcus]MCA5013657.1 WxL domain-containing protein [Enterococcus sp. S23]MCA5016907.1 WxL domain-containing protein [Enterococcus sp. S22(2020)]